MQGLVGVDGLFRGYAVKDQINNKTDTVKYTPFNKVIIRRFTEYYFKFQEERNKLYHDPKLQKELLLDWANRVKEIALKVGGNAQKFCEVHNLHRNGKTIKSLKDWIRSMKVIIKNENKGVKEDIRNYFIIRKRNRRQSESEDSNDKD